jgi:hypothetical protein
MIRERRVAEGLLISSISSLLPLRSWINISLVSVVNVEKLVTRQVPTAIWRCLRLLSPSRRLEKARLDIAVIREVPVSKRHNGSDARPTASKGRCFDRPSYLPRIGF